MNWDYHSIAGLINLICIGILSLFLLWKGLKTPPLRALFFMTLATTWWSFFYMRWILSIGLDEAIANEKLFTIGGIMAVPAMFHFVTAFLEKRISVKWIAANYSVGVLFAATNFFTSLYIDGYHQIGTIAFYPKAGIIQPIGLLYMLGNLGFSFWSLYIESKFSTGRKLQQVKWLLFGTSVAWISGMFTYFGFYGIPWPPYPTPFISIFLGVFVYALIKHKLMDLEVALRKTVVFASLFTATVLILSATTQLLPHLILEHLNYSINLQAINIVTFIGSFYFLLNLRKWMTDWTDRYLFQKEADPQNIIARILTKTNKVFESQTMGRLVLNELYSGMRLKSASFFIHDSKLDQYHLIEHYGPAPNTQTISQNSALRILSSIQKPIGIGLQPESEQITPEFFKELKSLNVQVAIPVMNEKNLSAIFFLGERLSDQAYTHNDQDYLIPLMRIISAIYQNTRLKEELHVAKNKVIAAHTDSLTGALVRSVFMENVEIELVRARHFNQVFSILMIDFDHFKSKNDTYGHLGGDLILKESAHKIRSSLRQQDLLGRFGGEEFIAFLAAANRTEALEIAERIRKKLEASPVMIRQNAVVQTASIGVACFSEDGHTISDLISLADECLYKAKESGRNLVADHRYLTAAARLKK